MSDTGAPLFLPLMPLTGVRSPEGEQTYNNAMAAINTEATGATAFTTPTLQNSWVNLGLGYANAGYAIHRGIVILRGTVKNGTLNSTLFTLPAGFRPSAGQLFAVNSNGAFGLVEVQADGDVVQVAGVTASLSLDGIRFLPI